MKPCLRKTKKQKEWQAEVAEFLYHAWDSGTQINLPGLPSCPWLRLYIIHMSLVFPGFPHSWDRQASMDRWMLGEETSTGHRHSGPSPYRVIFTVWKRHNFRKVGKGWIVVPRPSCESKGCCFRVSSECLLSVGNMLSGCVSVLSISQLAKGCVTQTNKHERPTITADYSSVTGASWKESSTQ